MPVNLVRDADIKAISIVGKGANRKTFFLRKADEGAEDVKPLSAGRLVKADDWSAVYCVVAEPGAHESAGMIGDQAIEDRWADEEEICKAAHRFMANGGLVNKMHESLEPYGQLVENAVALADFTVDGETIRKGSWYVAITPSEEGKQAIEKGEFTGVSVEGTAVRELVEKRTFGTKERKKLASEGKALPDGSYPIVTVADLENAISAFGRAKNHSKVKAHIISRAKALNATRKLPDNWTVKKGSTSDDPTVGSVEKTLLRKIAEKVGLKPEEIEAINKADRTFGEIIAQREFDKVLPEAFDAFRDAVWYAFFPRDGESADATALITESCDEFKAWALAQLEVVPVEKAERAEALGVVLDPEGSTQPASTKDGDMALTDSERQEFDDLKKAVEKFDADKLADSFAARLANALGAPAEDADLTPESIAKRAKELAGVTDEADLAKRVEKIQADVAKLAEGGSTQPVEGDEEPVSKEERREALEKAFKREGVNPALAGVLEG